MLNISCANEHKQDSFF